MKRLLAIISAILAIALSGCTITKAVKPASVSKPITKLYVEDNPKLFMDGLIPEVVAQIKETGREAEVFSGPQPADAVHVLRVDANWKWDMAMYLSYFRVMLMEDGVIVGTAEYDARMGGANFGKFGKTAEKIRPLLLQLLPKKS